MFRVRDAQLIDYIENKQTIEALREVNLVEISSDFDVFEKVVLFAFVSAWQTEEINLLFLVEHSGNTGLFLS